MNYVTYIRKNYPCSIKGKLVFIIYDGLTLFINLPTNKFIPIPISIPILIF